MSNIIVKCVLRKVNKIRLSRNLQPLEDLRQGRQKGGQSCPINNSLSDPEDKYYGDTTEYFGIEVWDKQKGKGKLITSICVTIFTFTFDMFGGFKKYRI